MRYRPTNRNDSALIFNDKNANRGSKSFYAKLSSIIFVVLLFFAFFGTSIPFQERITDVEDIGTSNIVNQVVYTGLFLLAIITLLPKIDILFSFFLKEKFLFFFLLWILLSLIWSEYPFISLKRIFRIITVTLVIVSFLLHHKSKFELVKNIRIILFPYLLLSIVASLAIPGAIDPSSGYWRGFAFTKNVLGEVSTMSIILSYIVLRNSSGREKLVAGVMIVISLALLFGSRSSTSLITFVIVLSLGVLISGDKIFEPIGLGKTVSYLIILSLALVIGGITYYAPELWQVIPEAVGKDVTFTGRTDLWSFMLIEINKHFFLGVGYQAFWVVESPKVLMLYNVFVWLPNQAHNGFLDMINEVGIIGFGIFIMMVGFYFINLIRVKEAHPWVWIIVATLIINFTESTLFRPGNLTGTLFILSYLVLFSELFHRIKTQD